MWDTIFFVLVLIGTFAYTLTFLRFALFPRVAGTPGRKWMFSGAQAHTKFLVVLGAAMASLLLSANLAAYIASSLALDRVGSLGVVADIPKAAVLTFSTGFSSCLGVLTLLSTCLFFAGWAAASLHHLSDAEAREGMRGTSARGATVLDFSVWACPTVSLLLLACTIHAHTDALSALSLHPELSQAAGGGSTCSANNAGNGAAGGEGGRYPLVFAILKKKGGSEYVTIETPETYQDLLKEVEKIQLVRPKTVRSVSLGHAVVASDAEFQSLMKSLREFQARRAEPPKGQRSEYGVFIFTINYPA